MSFWALSKKLSIRPFDAGAAPHVISLIELKCSAFTDGWEARNNSNEGTTNRKVG